MTEKIPKVALYARVSTTDQDCAMQIQELREFCERRGWILAAEYVDTGWSGAKKSRPQFDKLMAAARLHKFDIILVWKLDRFGRSVSNFVEAIQSLDTWGVRFICASQTIDTDNNNPGSKLLMTVLAAVAEFERSMIVERVKAGMKAAQRRGVHCGRTALVIDSKKVLELHLRGKSLRAIAKELRLQKDTVRNVLKRAAA